MNIGFEKQTGILAGRLIFHFLICFLLVPNLAFAAQWQKLTQTSRFRVSIDMDSIETKPGGNVSVCLMFIPLGAKQRREAAVEYSKSGYRQHMEHYEINCTEQSAGLKRLDIFEKNGKRIESITNEIKHDAIIPGSVLDMAALKACPEEEPVDTEEPLAKEVSPSIEEIEFAEQKISTELKQKIDEAITKTKSEPANVAAWIDLGNIYFDANMPKESIEAYSRALLIKPDNIETLSDQGAMHRRIGDFSNAIKNYERVLALSPNNLESLYIMGYIYAIELNRTNDAIPLWQRYLTLDNSSETARQIRQYIDKYGK